MFTYLYCRVMNALPKSEKGQDLSEYGLLVALVALIVIAAVIIFGQNLLAFFNRLAGQVASW